MALTGAECFSLLLPRGEPTAQPRGRVERGVANEAGPGGTPPKVRPAPRLRKQRAPSPGRGVPVPVSGGRDVSLPLTGNGRIGRGTCARPGLGALTSQR